MRRADAGVIVVCALAATACEPASIVQPPYTPPFQSPSFASAAPQGTFRDHL